jgi:anti-anti-sigma factor
VEFRDQLEIDITQSDGGVIVRLVGSASMEHCERLNESLLEAVSSDPEFLVLDMAQLEFICSIGLGAIVAAYLRARKRNSRFAIGAPNEAIQEILQVTKLDTILDVYDKTDQALEADSH